MAKPVSDDEIGPGSSRDRRAGSPRFTAARVP